LTKNPLRYEAVVLVSAGIGVTPMISILRYYFLYNVSSHVALGTPIHLAKHIFFVWTIPDMGVYEMFRDQITWCHERSGSEGFPQLHVQIYVTKQDGAKAEEFGLRDGDVITKRPDMKAVLQGVKEHRIPRTAVLMCGPKLLANATHSAVVELSDGDVLFDYHHETFEF
jgi:ferredoxin-NADP reductase